MHPYENIPLPVAGYVLAAWLIALHLWMLLKPEESKKFLIGLPRNKVLGPWLMGIGMAWFWLLIAPEGLGIISSLTMELGDFNKAKRPLQFLVPFAAAGMILHVKEFLTVRGLGLIALMAAAPLLASAWQDPPLSRLLVPIIAYAAVFKGLFWVGMPYTMRDAITWATKTNSRYKLLSLGGLGYGIAVLACSILFWQGC
ncbi:MAG: hypothetical protein ACPG32_14590 [Akkermansiaceae bacterium]